jgi:hypothetical protein
MALSAGARTVMRAAGPGLGKGAATLPAWPHRLPRRPARGRTPPERAGRARQRPGRCRPSRKRRRQRRNRMPVSGAFSAPTDHREHQAEDPDPMRRSTPRCRRASRGCRTCALTTAQIESRARRARTTLRISPSLEPRASPPRQPDCRMNSILAPIMRYIPSKKITEANLNTVVRGQSTRDADVFTPATLTQDGCGRQAERRQPARPVRLELARRATTAFGLSTPRADRPRKGSSRSLPVTPRSLLRPKVRLPLPVGSGV